MDDKKNYITPEGLARLKSEYHELMHVERPKVVEVVAWAASNGDRSENADYQYGKRRLREIDRRVHFLTKRIEDAEVVDPKIMKGDKVLFSATVTLVTEDGDEVTYQIVGEDENANIGYQVVPANIHIEVGRRYHLVARVSSSRHHVAFTVRDLDTPGAAVQSSVAALEPLSKISQGASPVVLGGLSKRTPTRQWDGLIEALRIVPGYVADHALNVDPANWNAGFVVWRAADPPSPKFAWIDSDSGASEENDPFRQAMTDLCKVLLNSNEFFYLH